MANAKLKDAVLCSLETKAIVVDSVFKGTEYVIDKSGKGMWIFINGKEFPILANQVIEFAREIEEVWKLHGVKSDGNVQRRVYDKDDKGQAVGEGKENGKRKAAG